jgi:hypothetical protein
VENQTSAVVEIHKEIADDFRKIFQKGQGKVSR